MNASDQLKRNYNNKAIYTSGFFAEPENDLANRQKLFDALKSLTANQQADTPFSLQIMATNSEINVMPLGLLDLDELKQYEHDQRQKNGLQRSANDELPLIVQFAPHTDQAKVVKKQVGSVQALFEHFNDHFEQVWTTVQSFLAQNESIFDDVERDLISDSADVKTEYQANFTKMTGQDRQKALGIEVKDDEIPQFSTYMADMHEVQAIVLSAAGFVTHELLGGNTFNEMMSNNVRRSTFFWVLDNTFYEIFYYFIDKYETQFAKLHKHLLHQRQTMITNMRNDAFQRAQKFTEHPQEKVKIDHYLTDVFVPIAEHLTAEVNQFRK